MVSGTLKSAKNRTAISRHFPHFDVVIYISCVWKKISPWYLENSCKSNYYLNLWKGAKSRLWSLILFCVIMTRDVLKILKRKSFLTRILQNFVLTEPGMVMSHLSDDYFSRQPSGYLDHSVAHWFLSKVCSEFRWFL